MRLGLAAFCGALICTALAAAADDGIHIERVFGPELPDAYKHPVSITELANGDLYLVYYGGSGEYGDDTWVRGSRLAKGSTRWTTPTVIADTPFRGDGNAVIWQAPDGLVWLFYVNRYGPTWSNSRIKYKISRDGAKTWSDSEMLSFDEGTMVRARPILLNNGDYLLPAYRETGNNPEFVGADTASYFYRKKKGSRDWIATKPIHSRVGNLQPSVVQITDKYLVAYSGGAEDTNGRTTGTWCGPNRTMAALPGAPARNRTSPTRMRRPISSSCRMGTCFWSITTIRTIRGCL